MWTLMINHDGKYLVKFRHGSVNPTPRLLNQYRNERVSDPIRKSKR
jgi:hypothetical protein